MEVVVFVNMLEYQVDILGRSALEARGGGDCGLFECRRASWRGKASVIEKKKPQVVRGSNQCWGRFW